MACHLFLVRPDWESVGFASGAVFSVFGVRCRPLQPHQALARQSVSAIACMPKWCDVLIQALHLPRFVHTPLGRILVGVLECVDTRQIEGTSEAIGLDSLGLACQR